MPQVLFVSRRISAGCTTGWHVCQALEGDHYLGTDHRHLNDCWHSRSTSVVAAVKQANRANLHARPHATPR